MVESTLTAESFFSVNSIVRGDLPALRASVWSDPDAFRAFKAGADELAAAAAGLRDPAKKREVSFRLGCAMWVLARYAEALAAFEEVKTRKDALWLMGACYMATGRPAAAQDALEKAERASGEAEFELILNLAAATRDAGNAEAAEKLLKKQKKAGEKSPDYQYEIARCAEAMGDYTRAVELYEHALELDPQCAKALFRLGYVHDLFGDDERALDYYERCAKMDQKHTNALLNLGVLYEDMNERTKALKCYEKVLKADPTHARAQLFYKDVMVQETEYYDDRREKTAVLHQAVLETPVTDFELSVRSRNCLEKMNIHTLGDLTRITEQELLSYKNFGETSLNEIKAILSQNALRLGQALEDGEGEDNAESEDAAILTKPVAEVDFSARSRRCMDRLKIETLADLVQYSRRELMDCPNLGNTSLKEIEDTLAEFNLTLREEEDVEEVEEDAS